MYTPSRARNLETTWQNSEPFPFSNRAIRNLRHKLYQFAGSINGPAGDALASHYSARIRISESRPMLGEHAAFMFGDLFSADDRNIDVVSFPWLLLYEYALVLDDLADDRFTEKADLQIVSEMLFENAVREYEMIFGGDKRLWRSFDYSKTQFFESMEHEKTISVGDGDPFSADLLVQQGRKSALAKICATSLMLVDKDRPLTHAEEVGIDHICTAVQLLDDVADVAEDFERRQSNPLLNSARKWVDAHLAEYKNASNQKAIIMGLIYSGALDRSWIIASEEIIKGLNQFDLVENRTRSYFHRLSDSCRKSGQRLEIASQKLPRFEEVWSSLSTDESSSKVVDLKKWVCSTDWAEIIGIYLNGPRGSQ